ncbi:DUF1295 domain-containing protein [Engelhardtia mirabilis]|uniref:3-oxo-5-alpha-steroid 4-dehydrogenase n=1 Tax=Engelhardtia mirabilis TaxID=2528011 RepID=A0A518BET2_9BACT|nr:3-oxo-5-alpha-steroid 4-dehydrogenase [Planctomycetes bacterium Pla133]QDU99821.1 3-oxo-5-alpha-steroid 4-dehydrogenase [Planctomycetes bacterium Pla86]
MFELGPALIALAALVGAMTLLWLLSRRVDDVSLVDPFWAPAFVLLGGVYAAAAEGPVGARGWLALGLVGAWAARLGSYLTWRWFQHEDEDARYAQMRSKRGASFRLSSLWIVFWLQAGLAWIVAAPLFAALAHGGAPGIVAWLGVGLWAVGMFYEAVGDWQLARFKTDPDSKGKVLDTGLWGQTRHPNYFGNFCIWWGVYLVAADASGWALASAYGALFMTLLLLKVSGVALLEKDIGERRPKYADYVKRVNAFFPGPQRGA